MLDVKTEHSDLIYTMTKDELMCSQFYRGMIVSSDISGQTCVVNFTDYASQQVTRLTDIRVVTKQYWVNLIHISMFSFVFFFL